MDTWSLIRAERASLVDALADLPEDKWDEPSLCAGWSVRNVVAHMISTAQMTPPKFFGDLIKSGFSFQAMSAKNIEIAKQDKSPKELVEEYRGEIDSRTAPPGPVKSWLGETLVHGEDITRALGSYRDHPVENVIAAIECYNKSNLLIGSKKRVAGVQLRTTDADWTYGVGPEVSGPAIAILMAMTGRKVALDDLSGDGVSLLRSRP